MLRLSLLQIWHKFQCTRFVIVYDQFNRIFLLFQQWKKDSCSIVSSQEEEFLKLYRSQYWEHPTASNIRGGKIAFWSVRHVCSSLNAFQLSRRHLIIGDVQLESTLWNNSVAWNAMKVAHFQYLKQRHLIAANVTHFSLIMKRVCSDFYLIPSFATFRHSFAPHPFYFCFISVATFCFYPYEKLLTKFNSYSSGCQFKMLQLDK